MNARNLTEIGAAVPNAEAQVLCVVQDGILPLPLNVQYYPFEGGLLQYEQCLEHRQICEDCRCAPACLLNRTVPEETAHTNRSVAYILKVSDAAPAIVSFHRKQQLHKS